MTRKVLLASTAVIPDTGGGDGEPDSLIPDPQVCREFGVSAMTLWRWERDPDLNFPTRITVRRRNYRSRQEIEKFKARLLRGAIARRSREARGCALSDDARARSS